MPPPSAHPNCAARCPALAFLPLSCLSPELIHSASSDAVSARKEQQQLKKKNESRTSSSDGRVSNFLSPSVLGASRRASPDLASGDLGALTPRSASARDIRADVHVRMLALCSPALTSHIRCIMNGHDRLHMCLRPGCSFARSLKKSKASSVFVLLFFFSPMMSHRRETPPPLRVCVSGFPSARLF